MNERSWIELNLSHFAHNIEQLKSKFAPADFMQIVKADAYGHGSYEISQKAIELGAKYLGVANLMEAKELRYRGIQIPILILSPSLLSEIDDIIDQKITPSISSLDFCKLLNKKSNSKNIITNIHINIDSGMGRSGFKITDALKNIEEISRMKNINIEGIFTHFAASESDENFTQIQYKKFKEILAKIDFKIPFVHLANSVAAIQYKFPEANLVRLGLLSYGIYAHKNLRKKVFLKQVMSFHTKISQIKNAKAGDSIGYNRTFIAPKNMKYAILPIGYADGYDFLLSNKGLVSINNNICKIIGKVSMDMITIDISHLEKVSVGDEVILLANQPEELQADRITNNYHGLSYELVCQLGRRAKRFYTENNNIITSTPISHRDLVFADFSNSKLNTLIETAVKQRLNMSDFSAIIYQEILKDFFSDNDENIFYRENFDHKIRFTHSQKYPEYFFTQTSLSFSKMLQNNYFYIVCATNERDLEKYLNQKDVEYRWLLDEKFDLEKSFSITHISVNNINLNISTEMKKGCLMIKCEHNKLTDLVHNEVKFSISTETFYPKFSHQFSVFISEITKNINIKFEFPAELNPEIVSIFSGRKKIPLINKSETLIEISSKKDEWIFPTSGVVFVY